MAVKVRLKELRTSRGLSQNKLAQLVSMTLQNIQKIEYGKTKGLQYDALNKLCKALNCQPGDILVYEPDDETEAAIAGQEKSQESEQGQELKARSHSKGHKRTHSFLSVIHKVPESA
jgi:putative transcriptional regulator